MARASLTELNAFVAIAEHRSFRQAADELGLSASALSHMMRVLEQRLAVRLLHRTTRSVSPTEAGDRLLARLKPALQDLEGALDVIDDFRESPGGTLRINSSEPAARLLLDRVVPAFLTRYPQMSLDIVTEGRLVDIVANGFDAGVRLGESVPQDMIAVRFGGRARFVTIASPAYLERRPPPLTPDDLKDHACIRLRLPSGKLYRWEFEKHGQELSVEISGALTLDHIELMIESAVRGLGIAYVPHLSAQRHIDSGSIVTVLDDWCPWIAGLYLYYPGNRHIPPGLRAFIEVLKTAL